MKLHENYQRLVEIAGAAHQAGRRIVGLAQSDIDLARLYSYAFRAQVIGAFHATQVALRACPSVDPRDIALHLLQDLADLAMDPIMCDGRALLSTFYRYDRGVRAVADALRAVPESHDSSELAGIA